MKSKSIQYVFIFLVAFAVFAFNAKSFNEDENLRKELIAFAKSFIGTPYVYSSSDPAKGFDCSGFVYYVFKKYSITVPRSSKEYQKIGMPLRPEEFKIGDIIVFYGYKENTSIGHLGIICEANGMNSKFVHASSGKVMSVTITDLNTEQYTKRFYKAIDVIQK